MINSANATAMVRDRLENVYYIYNIEVTGDLDERAY